MLPVLLPPKLSADDLRFERSHPWRTLYRLAALRPLDSLLIVVLYLIKAAPALLLPFYVASVVRLASEPGPGGLYQFWGLSAAFLILLVQNPISHVLFVRRSARIVRAMEGRLRSAITRHLQALTLSYHQSTEAGRLQAKVLRDVQDVIQLANQVLNTGIEVLIGLVWVLVASLTTDPIVGLFFCIIVPVMFLVTRSLRGQLARSNRAYRQDMERLSSNVAEMIEMIPVTRAHGLEDLELRRMGNLVADVYRQGLRLDLVNGFFQSVSWSSMRVTQTSVIILTGYLALTGRASVEQIVLYNGLFMLVMMNLLGLLNAIPEIARGLDAIRSLGDLLESPDLEANEGKVIPPPLQGSIEFRNVSLSYPGAAQPAVTDINLRIEPGQCVAFVGESGAGKSTLMNLVLGFNRPTHGQVLIDGRATTDLDMRVIRRQVAVVPQQTILFSGTIRDNITYGLEDCPEHRLLAAVDAANLSRFIADLPDGLETWIGKNGLKVSGGQRQRIAIARALIRDPQLIILDEATSALDVVSEREIQTALASLVQGRTTLIVAHRLSTIRMADRIVVMGGGRIVETGAHDELMSRKSLFRTLKLLQS
ncbi:MAG: ABC transporter ATP-binding protein [Candidatus Methylacidiphilales bacterium]